jgi:hypothetical protein
VRREGDPAPRRTGRSACASSTAARIVAGRELDLTAATKERLGFAEVGSVLVAG